MRLGWRVTGVAIALIVSLAACNISSPLQVVNHSPTVQGLSVFPTTLGVGDSAIVTCLATDADGDTVVCDWNADCRMRLKADFQGDGFVFNTFDHSMVVYAGACNRAPADTGLVYCEVRDRRGGGAFAGVVRIIVRQ